MGQALVKIKIMPSSPDVNLDDIENNAKEIAEKAGATGTKTEREPIAFGLNAIIIFFAWPEEKELEEVEDSFKKMENVASAEVIDMRRAL